MQNKKVIIILMLLFIITLLFMSCQKKKEKTSVLQDEISFSLDEINILPEESKNNSRFTYYDLDRETDMEITDVNGTWVKYERQLSDTRIGIPTVKDFYSWGTGKTIPNVSIDIDLGKTEICFADYGLHLIDNIYKNEHGIICLRLFFVGDEEHNFPLNRTRNIFCVKRKLS